MDILYYLYEKINSKLTYCDGFVIKNKKYVEVWEKK
jgi:hypothetical protein